MKSPYALLLAGGVFFATFAIQAPVHSAGLDRALTVAQNDRHNDKKNNKKDAQKGKRPDKQKAARHSEKKPEAKKPETKHQQKPAQQKSAIPQKPQSRPAARTEAKPQPKPQPKPQSKPAPQKNKPQQQPRSRAANERNNNHNMPAAQNRRNQGQHKDQHRQQPRQNANEHGKTPAPTAAQKPKQEQQPKSAAPAAAPNKQQTDRNKNKNAERHRNAEQNRHGNPEQNRHGNAEQNRRGNAEQRNRNAEKPQPSQPQQQAQPSRPGAPPAAPAAAERHRQNNEHRNARAPEPVKPHSAAEFIRRKGETPSQTIEQVRKRRTQTRQGNRVIVHEGDRTIVHNDKRTIIRHNEAQRFAVGARHVQTKRGKNNENVTIVERPNGVRIVNITDEHGRLIRRLRRDRGGHDVVIIDDSSFHRRGPDVDVYVDLPPVHIHHRDRYYVYADRASPAQIFAALTAAPIVALQDRYTVDQVRYSYPLRERMPRVDLDIHFDSGSWQLTPDQIERLQAIAHGLNRAIDRNPREVFLIEGHTDAVGSPEDNLSLSDRRAEAVAVALTEQFDVPPENLLTQGYGEEHLKVQTQDSSRENRRVTVLRITPLIGQAAR